MIKIFVTRNFDRLIRFVLSEYEIEDCIWRVIVLDDEEFKLFFDEGFHFNSYKNEFFEVHDSVEYDEGCLPKIHDFIYAQCMPCFNNIVNIKEIKDGLDPERLDVFNFETNFIQKVFRSYSDVDHLILINDERFSMLLNVERPVIIAHEAFHIVEYELCDQTHKYEEVQENATKLSKLYIASLTDDLRKSEFKKICSHMNGRAKYGKLRIISKFKVKSRF